MSTTKITKMIIREIQTKQYEQVKITVGREEELEWKNDLEKKQKEEKFTKDLFDDFTTTYNEACIKLGVDRCIGVVQTSNSPDNSKKPENKKIEKKQEPKSNTEFDF